MSDDRLRPPPEWMARKARRERGPGADMSNERTSSMTFDQVDPDVISTMREWSANAPWACGDVDDIDDLSDEEILDGIDAHYEGGCEQFMADS